MKLERFLTLRQPDWDELGRLCDDAGRRAESLGPDRVRRLGSLYRSAVADLAISRRRYSAEPVVQRLEHLVGRSRHLVYDAAPRRETIGSFFATGYWRRIGERPALLLVSFLLVFVPVIVGWWWAKVDPSHASAFLPGAFHSVVDRPVGKGISADASSAMSSMIFVNNIRVTLLSFAGGILAGVGTVLILFSNGLMHGVLGGVVANAGNGTVLLRFVGSHGFLEATCIVVAGAAGLRIAWAQISPGLEPRGRVLVRESRRAIEVIFGTAPWLVYCGLVEGFISPNGLQVGTALLVGVIVASPFWILLAWRGRGRASDGDPDHNRARDLARK